MRNKPFYLSDDHVRSFGGKLNGFENRDEAMREKKHLKAYLAGKKIYTYGYEDNGTQIIHEVKEIWTSKTQKQNAE